MRGHAFSPVRRLPRPLARLAVPRVRSAFWREVLPRGDADTTRMALSGLLALGDVAAVIGSALAAGLVYHLALYHDAALGRNLFNIGLIVAAFFVGAGLLRNEYQVERGLVWRGSSRRLIGVWTTAFLCALTLGFLTKTTGAFSRGATLLFYVGGFAAVIGARAAIVACAGRVARSALARRVFLVGYETEVEAFRHRYETEGANLRVVATTVLRAGPAGLSRRASDREQLQEDLALAGHMARFVEPDDVIILVPWSEHAAIDATIDAFMNLPAAIHLGPERVFDRFDGDVAISRLGSIASINLIGKPLSAVDIAAKRVFDVALASFALVALAPIFAAIAVLIRLDGAGPVLFRQKRYGFNQQPFRIYKFRSMTSLDDGAVVPQAAKDDARITRIGRVLRRWNLDELPQFLNVLMGEMSLVGPRPHAMAHDQAHERQFARYARRHNVKPGITGWAQVNGYRGEIADDEQMRARVEHDLYYIDHWSLWLDLKILVLTVISPKAYRNAR